MAVVVEPILTKEKLRSLLAEKHEQSCLDYKRSLNLAGNALGRRDSEYFLSWQWPDLGGAASFALPSLIP